MIAQGPQPDAQGLRAVPGAHRPAVPADPRRQRDRQPGPQHLGVQHHLLRPLPGRRRDVHRGGVRGRDPRPLVLPPAARLGQHHRRQAVPHHDRQPQSTRSSTTCSRTCRPAATRRSPARCSEICERYGLPYNTGPLRKQLGSVARKICRLRAARTPARRPEPTPSSRQPWLPDVGRAEGDWRHETDLNDRLSKAEIRKDAVQEASRRPPRRGRGDHDHHRGRA